MSGKLAHQLLDDDRVVVSFGSGVAQHVTAAEARRFAWSILADLDPEEAAAAQDRPKAVPAGERQRQVLLAISQGVDTAPRLQAHLQVTKRNMLTILSRLHDHDWIELVAARGRRTGKHGGSTPARWRLTWAGHDHLAELTYASVLPNEPKQRSLKRSTGRMFG